MTKNEIQFKRLKEEKCLYYYVYTFHKNIIEIHAYFDINSLSNVP